MTMLYDDVDPSEISQSVLSNEHKRSFERIVGCIRLRREFTEPQTNISWDPTHQINSP